MKLLSAVSFVSAALAAATLCAANSVSAADAEAAKALARQNNCFKCHGTDKEKDGPAYRAIAEKYRGKPDAQARLIQHLSSGEKAKFPDGHEEEHKIVQTTPAKDAEQIKNLVDWILSL